MQDIPLEDLATQLSEWRLARLPNCKGRIPMEIWDRAVELAVHQGIAPVARALAVDYASLKKRVNQSGAAQIVRTPAGFVEMMAPFPDVGQCILEVRSPRGGRMRIQMAGATSTALSALIRDFAK